MRDSNFTFLPGRAPISEREHDKLLDLIEGDASLEEIERAVRQHRASSLTAFLASSQGS
jgi:hypothetical protein